MPNRSQSWFSNWNENNVYGTLQSDIILNIGNFVHNIWGFYSSYKQWLNKRKYRCKLQKI
jgi:hypothetical protein